MQYDKEYEMLFFIANSELLLVEKNIHDNEIRKEILLFHLQQATEKFLKSLLSFKEIEFPKVHDIAKIVELCKDNGIELPECADELIDLNPFAVEFRYSIIIEEQIDVESYFEKVERLKSFVAKYMDIII